MTDPDVIDDQAPIVVRKQVEISASIDRVWQLHAHPAAYPEWQTSITSVEADGPLARGKSFTWTSFGFTVTSHVYALDEPRRTLWGGSADGITGIHEWRFTETGTGTRVHTQESWSGPTVSASLEQMRSALDGSLDTWVANLKRTAEQF